MPLRIPVRRRPRLRTVLLATNLLVLILPLAGLWFLRLYESALIRQTETELVAQAAVLTGAFRAEWRLHHPLPAAVSPPSDAIDTVRREGLDLARDPILPPAADPVPATQPGSSDAADIASVLAPILMDTQPVTLAGIRVLDASGRIIATTGRDLGLSLAGQDEVRQALAGRSISVMRRIEGLSDRAPAWLTRAAGLRVFVAMPVLDGGAVVGAVLLSRTPSTVIQAVWGKRIELGVLTAALLLTGIALAIGTSRLITQPVDALIVGARAVAAGRPGELVPPLHAGTWEIAELFDALTRMAETLQQRATYISSFAAHVSHEFKTPLAGARGAAELLADHGETMTQAERTHFLGVISESVVRLDRLVRGLLDLARADMLQPTPRAATALEPVLTGLAIRYRARGLIVGVQCGDIRAAITAVALEAILVDLLENAIDHAGTGAAVQLIAAANEAGRVHITVCDNGPGISVTNAGRIFEPFFTTRRPTGTGLGLAIARALTQNAGGALDLAPGKTGQGACFVLDLPGQNG